MSDGKDNLDLCALGAAVPNAAELSAEDKAYLVESIKNTLQGLAARHTDVLESLEPKVRKRVEALREIQLAAGPNGSQAMAEFIGSAVPNGVMSFINVGHSAALGSIGDVTGFGQDQQFTAVQMLFRSYEAAEPITRLGLNGSYEDDKLSHLEHVS
ncbi:LOB domain-containing protein 6-like [Hordeum vulgare subsp. vulgare]|uniref:LOB domain-containing protein 6-like n=1 Tax=Hordeum vulgare subsp. vulgare TaxID=112509 RepID=UPI001D1A3A17|nr:LOB domain-containing protein 6-like [Hordeum vulgare subsp. vulgare]